MTVYVITHKNFTYSYLPQKDYRVLLVGAEGKDNNHNYLADNTGDNISSKNATFCELTGLYWIWKHSKATKVGLVHYRRYFTNNSSQTGVLLNQIAGRPRKPLTDTQLERLLGKKKWIVAAPQKLNPGETIWTQFAAAHHIKDLKKTKEIISEMYDEKYIKAFDDVMQQNYLSPYNMFYTRREELNKYCEWLFPILFKLEKQVDISNYDKYQQRLFGFVSERLFNVYIRATAKNDCQYVGVVNIQENNKSDAFNQVATRLRLRLSFFKHKLKNLIK
ncbi:DUF4422 domain-containing protein [Limosilactobacillus secaliphilus]|uniref:DUF4422 domain-containing protein n=1 Tax=Limosilactobacillus secaliphilus TaxID=396268 RepID=A0A0R2I082_9LACO|nr:DUF4422 domain-containing protein [Limosilactobacillus secaliphilus]KRN58142.1 hypothetical protein IV45_GL000585 [Limosilactobacillus secaliphilus]